MSEKILGLEDVGRKDVDVAGGKGANLGEMVRSGFPIPPGFIVPAAACREFFDHIKLTDELQGLNDLATDETALHCRQIRDLIESAKLPLRLSEAIMNAHAELMEACSAENVCAVRSSATAEDLCDASFAGQHETYYYVQAEQLLTMVKHCWSSLFSPEAVSYRATQGMHHADVLMAVVVQKMIPSEISGVTFTANPVTGNREEIVTESSWGMGAAIVDGRVTPDCYVFERKGLRLKEKRIAEKKFMVPPRLPEDAATRLYEVPHAMQHRETLTEEQARMVAQWAIKAEEHFGCPQDIEWALFDGGFYMLQSRPITAMGHEDITTDIKGQYVIFKPLLENFTAPLTPLTQDMYGMMFAPPLFRMVKGWLYLNLKYVRSILPFKASDEDVAQFVYAMDTEKPSLKWSLPRLPFACLSLFFGYLVFGPLYARTRRAPVGFMDRYRRLARKVDQDEGLGPFRTLLRLMAWSRFFDPVGNQAIMVNLSSGRYMLWMDMLKRLLRRWAPDVREDAVPLICSGAEGVLSAEMGRGIWTLAKTARQTPKTREILTEHEPDRVLDVLKAEPEAHFFLEQLMHFLSINGHRGLKELELASSRWEEDPSPVLGMIRNYLAIQSDPEEHERRVNEMRGEVKAEIRAYLEKHPLEKCFRLRYRMIRYTARRTRFFARQRENSRFYHSMGFHMIRKKILSLEASLIVQGRLKCKGDIFFLHLPELEQLQEGKLGWLDVEDRIRDRRMEHIRLSKTIPRKCIGVDFPPREGIDNEEIEDGEVLSGQAASPGRYEGVAHVILDPSIDLKLKPGEILIAPYTDPAWTPLFLTAGAAAIEVGSYLSHAGTVAREFGMPCVVDLPDCTRRIQSGHRVRVDGHKGRVRILD